MTTTICGHDRETLKFVLRAHDMAVPTVREGILGNAETAAMDLDIAVPIQLIEVLGETLRGFGFSVNGDKCDEKQTVVDIDLRGMANIITVKVTDPEGLSAWFDLTMSKARAFVLALLNAPNVKVGSAGSWDVAKTQPLTTQDVERMIQEAMKT